MGKVKKQRKQKRETPYAKDISMEEEETEPSMSVISAYSSEAPQGPKAYSEETGETASKMKARHSAEWKKVREEMDKLRIKRKKLSKHDPAAIQERKELLNQIKQMQIDYQTRVEKERAGLKKTDVLRDAKTGETSVVLAPPPETLHLIQSSLDQKLAQVLAQVANLQKKVKEQDEIIKEMKEKSGADVEEDDADNDDDDDNNYRNKHDSNPFSCYK